ncbi:hypothetical protein A2U01_0111528, partial [Trifolium medium]|nr:hypothetical protein [Trifolium medium]
MDEGSWMEETDGESRWREADRERWMERGGWRELDRERWMKGVGWREMDEGSWMER